MCNRRDKGNINDRVSCSFTTQKFLLRNKKHAYKSILVKCITVANTKTRIINSGSFYSLAYTTSLQHGHLFRPREKFNQNPFWQPRNNDIGRRRILLSEIGKIQGERDLYLLQFTLEVK